MWWSFGSGLLADWCLITWTLWQYLDYGDCDSAAGGSTLADCTALTWQSTALVIMTGLGPWIFSDEHEFARCDGSGLIHLTGRVRTLVTLLGDAETQMGSPEANLPPLILPVVVTDINVAPETVSPPLILRVVVEESSVAAAAGLIELVPSTRSSSLPPPPGFSTFAFPLDDGGLDADELCARLGMNYSPSVSPLGRVSSDVPDLAVSPEVGVLVSPIVDGSSDVAPAVGYTGSPLPSVASTCGQTMLWVPAAPPDRSFTC